MGVPPAQDRLFVLSLISLDSNVVVGLFEPRAPASQELVQLLGVATADGHRFCTPVYCVGEFWRVVTEPGGYDRDLDDTIAFLSRWLTAAPMISPGPAFQPLLMDALAQIRPVGAQIFDVSIGVVSAEAKADELWTLDQRFPDIRGLKVDRNPLLRLFEL